MAITKQTYTQPTTNKYGTNTKWFAEKIAELVSFRFPNVAVTTDTTSVYDCILYGSGTMAMRIYNSTSSMYLHIGTYVDGVFSSLQGQAAQHLNRTIEGYTMTITVTAVGEDILHITCGNTYISNVLTVGLLKLVSRADGTERIAARVSTKKFDGPTSSYVEDDVGGVWEVFVDRVDTGGAIDENSVILIPALLYTTGFGLGCPTIGNMTPYGCAGMTIDPGKIYTLGGKQYLCMGSTYQVLVEI